MQPTIPVADVVLEARMAGGGAVYVYRIETPTHLGAAHFVPLGTRRVIGFVAAMREVHPRDLGFPLSSLRPLGQRIADMDLPKAVMDLCRFTASEYLCPLPAVINLASPASAGDRLITRWQLIDDRNVSELPRAAQEALIVLREKGGVIVESKAKPLASSAKRSLNRLVAQGIAERVVALAPAIERRRLIGQIKLTSDEGKVEKFLKREGAKKPAQAAAIIALSGSQNSSFSAQEIKALADVTDAQIRALLQAGILEAVEAETPNSFIAKVPNAEQVRAIDALTKAIASRESKTFLLFGVTGSGKTEVYLRAAAETLKLGRRVLFLVPEIALTPQMIAQLRERFGNGVALVHSALQPNERFNEWSRIRNGDAAIVLGARSALFAPLDDVGLIIMDEEHEASYKQESAPRYHARRLARFLSERHRAVLVLGSATPSAETWYDGKQGLCTVLRLERRAKQAKLPSVDIEDLSLLYREKRASMFTDELRRRISHTVARGEQVILFLNRRAYAQFLLCRDCGFSAKCPDCAVSLSYHLYDKTLRCHHCGYKRKSPDFCPACHGSRLKPIGAGTQRVEETLATEFPGVVAARMDRDIARKKGALEETLAKFRAGEIQVLAGTQIIAKGLDFPNVTLVGVIAADLSLGFPDFRASERTFQLLSQVAGRAGRGDIPGHVIIQTFAPQHSAIAAATAHSYEPFVEELLEERQLTGYPPFHRLVNILVTSEDKRSAETAALDIASTLRGILTKDQVKGPAVCMIERLQKRWRRHVLLFLQPDASTSWIEGAIGHLQKGDVQIIADVDPISVN